MLFVGDKPSSRMKPNAAPFQGAACEKRLYEWIVELGVSNYKIKNQCDLLHVRYFSTHLIIIALGNKASKSLGKVPHFKLPHPSGLNRQVNDKTFIASKLAECKNYIERATVK